MLKIKFELGGRRTKCRLHFTRRAMGSTFSPPYDVHTSHYFQISEQGQLFREWKLSQLDINSELEHGRNAAKLFPRYINYSVISSS